MDGLYIINLASFLGPLLLKYYEVSERRAWMSNDFYSFLWDAITNPGTYLQVDGLVQERRNSIALAMELRLSCSNPSKYDFLLYSC